MAASVTGTRRAYSLGSLMLYVQPLIKTDDASTHASSLNNIRGQWATAIDIIGTSTNASTDLGEASGTITVNCNEANRNVDVYITTPELE